MKENENIIRGKRHIVDIAFVVALVFLFAFSAVTLIALGASIYRRNVNLMSQNYDSRTSFAYISEKIRQADINGNIEAASFGSIPSLRLKSEVNGETYYTYLYSYNGYLTELMMNENATGIIPAAGQKIVEITDFTIEQPFNTLYKITITRTDGEELEMYITVHSSKE